MKAKMIIAVPVVMAATACLLILTQSPRLVKEQEK